jgi:hypothetical protein
MFANGATDPVKSGLANYGPEYIGGLLAGQGVFGAGASTGLSKLGQHWGGAVGRALLHDNTYLQKLANDMRTDSFSRVGKLAEGETLSPIHQFKYDLSAGDLGEIAGSTVGGAVGFGAIPVIGAMFHSPENAVSSVSAPVTTPPALNAEQVKKAQQRALEQAALNQYYAQSLATYPIE